MVIDKKLKFKVKKNNDGVISITASIFVPNENKSIYIEKNAKDLFKYTKKFSIDNHIQYEKSKEKFEHFVLETYIFDEALIILEYFKKYFFKRQIIRTILAFSGVITITPAIKEIVLSNSSGDGNDCNFKTEKMINDVIVSNIITDDTLYDIIKIANNNSKLKDLDIKYDNVFNYDYENRSDDECVTNSKQYMYFFEKMGNTYGIDPNLLMAIMAQESSGIHYSYSQNGAAIGGMQIESFWFGKPITAFNFELGQYETINVDESRIGDVDYNIKVASMILQDNLKVYDYNIPMAVQAYNYGIPNMNRLGDDWIDNRKYINCGDSMYFEHVFSFLPNNFTLEMKKADGSFVFLTLNNLYNNKGRKM